MYKKALSLLLALMLIVTSFSVAVITVAADDGDPSGVKVTATSNFFPSTTQSFTKDEIDGADGFITVTYFIQSEENLLNTDWLLTYDGTVLQFDEEANTTGEGRNARLDVMPSVSDEFVNTKPTSAEYGLRGNCTSLSSYPLNDGEGGKVGFVTVTFKVIGSGDTTVDLNVYDLRMTKLEDGQTVSQVDNETQVVDNGVVVGTSVAYDATTEVYTGPYNEDYEQPEETTAPAEETTVAPEETTEAQEETTEAQEETTEPGPVEDETYVVAGTPADIFGTAWDASNESNIMTKNDDGKYEKSYTTTKAYDAVQLKVVKNGSEWIGDATGNNVTFNVTGPGTFTVTFDPETNEITVTGDNVEQITEFTYNTVYAVGNGEGFWLNGASWDPAFASNEMDQIAEDLWEISFDNVPDGFERQIKFAIDGAWTHNFGGAYDAEHNGEPQDAVYNGDNITFDTYEDSQTVKVQLDLRDFDFTTKEGAKFTLTIIPDEEEVTTEAVEETTDAVEETTVAIEETTVAEETQPPTEPAPAAALIVKGTSNVFPETSNAYNDLTAYEDDNHDVFVTVEYKLAAPGQYLINIDGELTWDKNVLEFKEAYNKLGTGRQAKFTIFPFAYEQGNGGGMVNSFGDSNSGRVVGNYTSVSPAAYAYEEDGSPVTVVRAVFKVLDREAGETTVNFRAETLSLCDETEREPYSKNVLVNGGVVDDNILKNCTTQTIIKPDGQVEPPVVETTVAPEETTVAPEETTVAPEETTEAQEETTLADVTTTPQGENLTVNGTSNYCPSVDAQTYQVSDTVTVTFKAPEEAVVVDLQWGMNYNKDLLELTDISTFSDKMLINRNAESFNVLGSYTDISRPVTLNEGDDFITFTFKAKAAGDATVDFRVIDMTVREDGEDNIIFADQVDQRQQQPEETTVAPEETTVAPEETTEAGEATTVAGDTLDVSGTSNYCPIVDVETYEVGDTVTVTFKAPDDAAIVDLQWGMNYEKDLLELTDITSFSDKMMINRDAESFNVLGSYTDISRPASVEEGDDFITFTFKAKAAGLTNVDFRVIDMTVREEGEDEIIFKDQIDQRHELPEVTTGPVEETTEAVEETTEAVEETTEAVEETTEAVEETTGAVEETTAPAGEDTFVVAGSPADIFGTAWDAANTDNTMTKNGDGKFEISYTTTKDYNDVQLKVVKNGSEWIGDETGNNVTFNVTGPGTFKVTIDPETNEITVTGDNVEQITDFSYTTVYAVGNGEGYWLNGVAWDPGAAANEMTKVADDIWEITFDNVPDGFERQIKFAIDGAWTHNFGGAYDAELNGQPQDAVYNGDNITFDTEDTCTVKVQLDLRNFDFTTKEGAKYTLTITYPQEPTVFTTPVEETTVAPEETTVPEEETTVAPEETTVPEEETTVPEEETTVPVEEGTTVPDEEGTTVPDEEGTTVPDGEGTTSADDTAGTSSTDATSATGGSSTADSSTSDQGGNTGDNGGFVQTGNASMAIIILLVLLSATVGIWFARRKVK